MQAALTTHKTDIGKALKASSRLQVYFMVAGKSGQGLSGHGPSVPAADAARNADLYHIDGLGRVTSMTMASALERHMVAAQPFVIAGAGTGFEALVQASRSWLGTFATDGMVVQYVGLDPQHWDPDTALAFLEKNIVCTAAVLVCNSCLNKAGHEASIVAHGFGCWVVNRTLRLLPRDMTWYASVMQMDALGSAAAMDDLLAAKNEGLAAICHVQSSEARANLADKFRIPKDVLSQLPVDIAVE
ncbi:hypothetical protein MAA8898_01154 [Maliponia aquimaris]|uniref:Uncharacterized protein n=1 Tax=Maliponia aquimaris TaxID=1673631 RepID=A0A238K3H2_9RHOB|nr:hypothetical protein MAA8898_01154 [Maliponia aquimaris]